jgi:4-hydroxybenzoate polyprenyltransferase
VAPSARRLREIAAASSVRQVFAAPAGAAAEYLRALRPHHWIKNVLLLVAVATAHRWPDLRTQAVLLWGLVAFCLCASSNYLLNDLFDLTSDRRHPEIRHRPLASGLIRPSRAVLLLTVLLVAALAIAARLSPAFLGILVAYYLLITLYSLRLKEVAVLDVFILAGGYALRVAAGAYVVGIRPSMWLIALCAFLFLSLALIKRYAELIAIGSTAGPTARVRGYLASDASLIASEGVASGYLAVLVLALYTNTSVAQQFYGRHELFWAIALLLLYWINYLWLMARRGRIAHDPVVFALQNRTSQLLVIAMAVVTACAL